MLLLVENNSQSTAQNAERDQEKKYMVCWFSGTGWRNCVWLHDGTSSIDIRKKNRLAAARELPVRRKAPELIHAWIFPDFVTRLVAGYFDRLQECLYCLVMPVQEG